MESTIKVTFYKTQLKLITSKELIEKSIRTAEGNVEKQI